MVAINLEQLVQQALASHGVRHERMDEHGLERRLAVAVDRRLDGERLVGLDRLQ